MRKIATREAYGNALAKLVEKNKNIIVLDADLSGSTKTSEAKKVAPKQHFNIGIAESNMMCMAAGLASAGKIVFASSFAMFAVGRAFEPIRNSIAYPGMNVKICATHAGISLGEDGATHQAIEDIALMRSVPNMIVISPSDAIETEEAIAAVAEHNGPAYVRLGRIGVEVYNDASYKFELGKGIVLSEGENVAIVSTGLMVQESLKAKKMLSEKGINPTIINIHTIKPIDKELLLRISKNHSLIVTAEEHNIMGGLGSAVAEILSEESPIKIVRIGIDDVFGESGKSVDVMEKYGLTAKNIYNKVIKELS